MCVSHRRLCFRVRSDITFPSRGSGPRLRGPARAGLTAHALRIRVQDLGLKPHTRLWLSVNIVKKAPGALKQSLLCDTHTHFYAIRTPTGGAEPRTPAPRPRGRVHAGPTAERLAISWVPCRHVGHYIYAFIFIDLYV